MSPVCAPAEEYSPLRYLSSDAEVAATADAALAAKRAVPVVPASLGQDLDHADVELHELRQQVQQLQEQISALASPGEAAVADAETSACSKPASQTIATNTSFAWSMARKSVGKVQHRPSHDPATAPILSGLRQPFTDVYPNVTRGLAVGVDADDFPQTGVAFHGMFQEIDLLQARLRGALQGDGNADIHRWAADVSQKQQLHHHHYRHQLEGGSSSASSSHSHSTRQMPSSIFGLQMEGQLNDMDGPAQAATTSPMCMPPRAASSPKAVPGATDVTLNEIYACSPSRWISTALATPPSGRFLRVDAGDSPANDPVGADSPRKLHNRPPPLELVADTRTASREAQMNGGVVAPTPTTPSLPSPFRYEAMHPPPFLLVLSFWGCCYEIATPLVAVKLTCSPPTIRFPVERAAGPWTVVGDGSRTAREDGSAPQPWPTGQDATLPHIERTSLLDPSEQVCCYRPLMRCLPEPFLAVRSGIVFLVGMDLGALLTSCTC